MVAPRPTKPLDVIGVAIFAYTFPAAFTPMGYDWNRDTLGYRLRRLAVYTGRRVEPRPVTRRFVAAGMLLAAVVLLALAGQEFRPGFGPKADIAFGAAAGLLIGLVVGVLAWFAYLLLRNVHRVISPVGVGVIAGLLVVGILIGLSQPLLFPLLLLIAVGIPLLAALLFSALAVALQPDFRAVRRWKKAVVVTLIAAGIWGIWFLFAWSLSEGLATHLIAHENGAGKVTAAPELLTLGEHGAVQARYLRYGPHAEGHFKTATVDVTPFTSYRTPWRGRLRERFLRHDLEHAPIAGRVWYPEGAGPFPLILVVHGNHVMEEASDPGYDYLGEHFASRGYITVSVDQNFLNSSWSGNLKDENDARAWVVLKHLELWRKWQHDAGHPFAGKVDLGRIALIGHSRGGEAVAVAAAFNRLKHYPDDATQTFDFNFDIRAVIAIAPVDGQYEPAGKQTPLTDVNYLVVHGAHDADVNQFVGARQWRRVQFTGDAYRFKASLYIYRANHGQFNRVWGAFDTGMPFSLTLNRAPLLAAEEQQHIARVAFTAFLEAALHNRTDYLVLFRDGRVASAVLPDDYYITRFMDSTATVVADFEEDLDATTTSADGGAIVTRHLATWREQMAPFRKNGDKDDSVVYVGWKPDAKRAAPPAFEVQLPPDFAVDARLNNDAYLTFAVAQADEKPGKNDEDDDHEIPDKKGRDFTVVLIDDAGREAAIPLSRWQPVPPILPVRVSKLWNEAALYGKRWEPALQTFELPLHRLVEANPALSIADLRTVRFVFDRSPSGVLMFDDIGFGRYTASTTP